VSYDAYEDDARLAGTWRSRAAGYSSYPTVGMCTRILSCGRDARCRQGANPDGEGDGRGRWILLLFNFLHMVSFLLFTFFRFLLQYRVILLLERVETNIDGTTMRHAPIKEDAQRLHLHAIWSPSRASCHG